MQLLGLLRFFHALFLFLREMWLRDRTFRQYVRENLSLILVSVGFAVMTVLFINVYIIVKDQEGQKAVSEQKVTLLEQHNKTLVDQVTELTERTKYWREKYLLIVENPPACVIPDAKPAPVKPEAPAPKVPPKPPQDSTPAARPPSSTLVDRWKRLNQ